jgi:ATP-binding cassette subfamily F protein 3
LALALLIWQRPNLLLLDEPTNHLDLEMRHALTLALQEYDGGVVLVSHDRALLRATCDRFVLVADGGAAAFDGDLEDYKQWLADQRSAEKAVPSQGKVTLKAERAQAQADRQSRLAQRRPLVKEVEQLEKNITNWQAEKKLLEDQLGDSALYEASSSTRLQALLKRQAELARQIEQAEERWLQAHEQLETLSID